jgi:hypothetical protein
LLQAIDEAVKSVRQEAKKSKANKRRKVMEDQQAERKQEHDREHEEWSGQQARDKAERERFKKVQCMEKQQQQDAACVEKKQSGQTQATTKASTYRFICFQCCTINTYCGKPGVFHRNLFCHCC